MKSKRIKQMQHDPVRDPRLPALHIRLTADERATLTARAEAQGVTLSAYIRGAALDGVLPEPTAKARRTSTEPRPVLTALELRELNAVGVNLNQIARHLNAGHAESVDAGLSAALVQLEAILERYL